MKQSNFEYAANWVLQRVAPKIRISQTEIASALLVLYDRASKCSAAVMIPDLFPCVTLETIYIPASNQSKELATGGLGSIAGDARLTVVALSAIGAALIAELEATSNDIVRCELESGAQVIVYQPNVRDIVLQATNLVLLAG